MVTKHLTPTNVLLAASTLFTVSGLFVAFFPQNYSDLIRINPAPLTHEAKTLLQLVGVILIFAAGGFCAVHKHPSVFALRTYAAGFLSMIFFNVYVALQPEQIYKKEVVALWALIYAAFGIYFLTIHPGHKAGSIAAPAAASPKGRGRGKSPRKST